MAEVVVLAFTAALNPTEVAAIAVMLLLPSPDRLMFGYWLGAMLTGVVSGSVIVFALEGTGAEHTTRHTVGPVVWLVVAALLVIAAFAIARGEDKRMRERRRERHPQKERKTPRWQKTLAEGNAWHTFVVGILLSFPGASYLAALDRIIHLHYATVVTILVLVGFNLVQNILIEAPLLAFRIWPTKTPAAIDSAKAWAASHGREYGSWALALLGVALAIPSIIALLSR
jgi:Sap, sulfolipid-1-addressing protein